MRLLTAGESHGPALTGIIEGLPAGLRIDAGRIDAALKRRQAGFGRGGRMRIESDTVRFTAGLRDGVTLGSPLCFYIDNKDHAAWASVMGPTEADTGQRRLTAVRPGHADFAGSVKYGFSDARNVLERASARETAVRVAAGAVAAALLAELSVEVGAHIVNTGGVAASDKRYSAAELNQNDTKFDVGAMTETDAAAFKAVIQRAMDEKDTVGGIAEVVVSGLPAGIGSYVHYDRKLSTALFAALGSVQSVKCVEIGLGKAYAPLFGSEAHDELFIEGGRPVRRTNRAGGVEGGVSNGADIVLRATLKPIPTVMKGLKTVDINTKQPCLSAPERSDCCALFAAAEVLKSVTAFAVAHEALLVTGGDTMDTVRQRFFSLPGFSV
ncbi:MAG: chorismate synthase [Clostridiales bacterium]|jgi:chorismate synthase|nr:chorismate synthase [Clostridiales bacterium]